MGNRIGINGACMGDSFNITLHCLGTETCKRTYINKSDAIPDIEVVFLF